MSFSGINKPIRDKFQDKLKKVNYNGEIMSLTRLTIKIKGLDHNIQPTPHWFYNGKSVKDIYDETYDFEN